MMNIQRPVSLKGRKALVTGIANDQSIAWGCAQALHLLDAEVAVTYLNEKAKPYVEPLARQLDASLLLPMDLRADGQLEAVFERIEKEWGRLDILLHSVAFAPRDDLHGRVVDCSKAGFLSAMDVSCWSFIRMAHLAEPLMREGGVMFTMTYYGSQMVVENYNMMGPVKAALESSVRYLAVDFGKQKIRVNAISAGPVRTLAGAGITDARAMFAFQQQYSPLGRGITLEEMGGAGLYLLSNLSSGVTGEIHFVDSGYNVIAMPHPDALKDSGQG